MYKILVFFGFLSIGFSQDETLTMDEIFLMPLDELLNVKVYSASQTSELITDAPATILVITSKQIEERGYMVLEDALRDLPGFDMVRVYGAYPTIMAIRGSYGDENQRHLLMIDGNIENSVMGSFEMGGPAYSLFNIDRIEVILGPASALYGANAFTGIINMITKMGEKHEGVAYRQGFGTYNTRAHDIALNTSSEHADISLSGSLFNTDGPKFTRRHPHFSDAYVDHAFSIVGRFRYHFSDAHILTLGGHVFDHPSGDGTFGITARKSFGLPTDETYQNAGASGFVPFDLNQEHGSLWHAYTETYFTQYKYKLQSNLDLQAKLLYHNTGLRDDSYSYFSPGTRTLYRNRYTHESFKWNGDLRINYTANKNRHLIVGLQFDFDDMETRYRNTIPDTVKQTYGQYTLTNLNATFAKRENILQENYGIYGQYIIRTTWLNQTTFTLGSRFDKNDKYGSTFNPRLGVVVRVNNELSVKALIGTAFRAPSSFERYNISPVRIANPDLTPETNETYEIGISYKRSNVYLQTNVFFNTMKDVITGTTTDEGKNQFKNGAKIEIYGAEISVNTEFMKRFTAFLNLSFQKAEQSNRNQMVRYDSRVIAPNQSYKVPNIAEQKGNMGVTYREPHLFSIHLKANWVGKRSVAVTNPLGSVERYFTVNTSLSTQPFANKKFSLMLKAKNLLNAHSVDPGVRSANGNIFYATVQDQPGREVYLSFRVDL